MGKACKTVLEGTDMTWVIGPIVIGIVIGVIAAFVRIVAYHRATGRYPAFNPPLRKRTPQELRARGRNVYSRYHGGGRYWLN